MSVSPCLLTRRISKDAFRGSSECMWRCLRSTRSNACSEYQRSILLQQEISPAFGDTVRWLIGSTSLDQGHAERAEGLGQIDACEMSASRQDVVLPFGATVEKSHVPLMLSGQRGVSL